MCHVCRCALQESCQLQGQMQELSTRMQELTQELLQAQQAKVGAACLIMMGM